MCWGSTTFSETIGETPSIGTFSKIEAGNHHVCGIRTDGTVLCWGGGVNDASGHLDYGQTDLPQEYRRTTFADVAGGRYHSCGVLDDRNDQTEGEVVCWGARFEYDPIQPIPVEGGRTTIADFDYPPPSLDPQVETGLYHNCALTDQMDITCWGGSDVLRTLVPGPYKSLAVGWEHTCGVRDDGHVMCWGSNTFFESSGRGLANLSPQLQDNTVRIENLTTDYTFKSVTADKRHTCGILDGQTAGQTSGSVLCWGWDANDQSSPPPDTTFADISVGMYHGCGLLDGQNGQLEGSLSCWGATNNPNENGNPNDTETIELDPYADYGQAVIPEDVLNEPMIAVSAGLYHTCALKQDGEMRCWGYDEIASIPAEMRDLRFPQVSASRFITCGITVGNRVKCWEPDGLTIWPDTTFSVSAFNLDQFHVPEQFVDEEFGSVDASVRHACATRINGTVACWGVDADPSTAVVEIFTGITIINTGQAWVPRRFRVRAPAAEPDEETGILPTSNLRILRIGPTIREVFLRPGELIRLRVEVYGRQDIRDDSLGDRADVSFEWTAASLDSAAAHDVGRFHEDVAVGRYRPGNDEPDDRSAMYNGPDVVGRYQVKVSLEPGVECLGKREGETDEDVLERCTAIFGVTVKRPSAEGPTPVPPRNPVGEIPTILADANGEQYEVFTPEGGGTFTGDNSSLSAGPGVVPNGEIVGLRISDGDLAFNEGKTYQRYNLGGKWYEVSVVDALGNGISSYRLNGGIEVCIPLPDELRTNI